jgi:riboflavin synthase
MFTGIIEQQGRVEAISHEGSNITFTLSAPMAPELQIDQSLAHDGVCLTVVAVDGEHYQVTAVAETLHRTNLGQWQVGQTVNLERCMPANGRFDGHIVQGHVDTTATVLSVADEGGSWLFRFQLASSAQGLLVDKGSITINGVSLTVFNVEEAADAPTSFSVAIIPYTYQHTGFGQLAAGHPVNIEFDIIGKYVRQMLALRQR